MSCSNGEDSTLIIIIGIQNRRNSALTFIPANLLTVTLPTMNPLWTFSEMLKLYCDMVKFGGVLRLKIREISTDCSISSSRSMGLSLT